MSAVGSDMGAGPCTEVSKFALCVISKTLKAFWGKCLQHLCLCL